MKEVIKEGIKKQVSQFLIDEDICFYAGGKILRDKIVKLVEDAVNSMDAESWAETSQELPKEGSFVYFYVHGMQYAGIYSHGSFMCLGMEYHPSHWVYQCFPPID